MPTLLAIDAPHFEHLAALTDERGLLEHARGDEPRPEHGYCVDDAARALVVVTREQAARAATGLDASAALEHLVGLYLPFVASAIDASGGAHNRANSRGAWVDDAAGGDWWGRAVFALGTTATHAPAARDRALALDAFVRASRWTTLDRRAHAFAALGAVEVLAEPAERESPAGPRAAPAATATRRVLASAVLVLATRGNGGWPWPEPRLTYANAALPEALIACGVAAGDDSTTRRGLALLGFLLATETRDGHLSVTGSRGRDQGEAGPLFDQQPIEVEALASACARAYAVTHDGFWKGAVDMAWAWFLGDNDIGVPMVDPDTGAGYDGLMVDGRNDNRGAESTLAALSTFQHARALGLAGARL